MTILGKRFCMAGEDGVKRWTTVQELHTGHAWCTGTHIQWFHRKKKVKSSLMESVQPFTSVSLFVTHIQMKFWTTHSSWFTYEQHLRVKHDEVIDSMTSEWRLNQQHYITLHFQHLCRVAADWKTWHLPPLPARRAACTLAQVTGTFVPFWEFQSHLQSAPKQTHINVR